MATKFEVFESSVVLDGTKTRLVYAYSPCAFESSVVLDGTKTTDPPYGTMAGFESSVVLDGTKTRYFVYSSNHCFACDARGDVIDYAANLFSLPLYEAAQRLAADFCINADRPSTQAVLEKRIQK